MNSDVLLHKTNNYELDPCKKKTKKMFCPDSVPSVLVVWHGVHQRSRQSGFGAGGHGGARESRALRTCPAVGRSESPIAIDGRGHVIGMAVDGPRTGQNQRILASSHSVNVLAWRLVQTLRSHAAVAAFARVRMDGGDGRRSRWYHDNELRLLLGRWRLLCLLSILLCCCCCCCCEWLRLQKSLLHRMQNGKNAIDFSLGMSRRRRNRWSWRRSGRPLRERFGWRRTGRRHGWDGRRRVAANWWKRNQTCRPGDGRMIIVVNRRNWLQRSMFTVIAVNWNGQLGTIINTTRVLMTDGWFFRANLS